VASTAFGIAALYELSGENPSGWRIALPLTLSVASHGIGVAFLAAASVFAFVSRRWSMAAWIAIPLVVLASWSVALQLGELSKQTPITWPGVPTIGLFILVGTAASVTGPFGLRPEFGVILLPIGSIALARLSRPASPTMVAAAAAAIATEFALVALIRGNLGPAETASQRYLYVSVPFLLLLIGGWLGSRPVPLPADPRLRFTLIALVTTFVVLGSARSLVLGRLEAGKWSDRTRAVGYLAEHVEWLPAVSILLAPPPSQLVAVLGSSGGLDQDRIVGISFGPPPRDAIAWACDQFLKIGGADPTHSVDACVADAAGERD
jgi:hypothetical protein